MISRRQFSDLGTRPRRGGPAGSGLRHVRDVLAAAHHALRAAAGALAGGPRPDDGGDRRHSCLPPLDAPGAHPLDRRDDQRARRRHHPAARRLRGQRPLRTAFRDRGCGSRGMGGGAVGAAGAARRAFDSRQSRMVVGPGGAGELEGTARGPCLHRTSRHPGLRERRRATHQGRAAVLACRARRPGRLPAVAVAVSRPAVRCRRSARHASPRSRTMRRSS